MQQSGMEVFVDEKAQQVPDEVNERVKMRMGDAAETFNFRQKEAAETRGMPYRIMTLMREENLLQQVTAFK